MTTLIVRADAARLPLADASVDAVVCDPPYGLEFMGREWDSFKPSSARLRTRVDGRTNPADGKSVTTTPEAYVAGVPFQAWCQLWAAECLRVLKPGGHLLAFGGTRTWHRMVCAIEDAGFEIRDQITWVYASGFPKSLDVSKAIDKAAGAEREVVGMVPPSVGGGRSTARSADGWDRPWMDDADAREKTRQITAPATELAARWEGWGTALKPASEPIVVARKPLVGTVAQNVLAHGTGALNIDACRIELRGEVWSGNEDNAHGEYSGKVYGSFGRQYAKPSNPAGRWPSNVVLSHAATPDGEDLCGEGCVPGCPVAELDAQSGASVSRVGAPRGAANGAGWGMTATGAEYDDSGGASRFFPVFRYQAKADASERPRVNGVAHPTVKPLDLMRWLVRLVTPPGGILLDPFSGSGTTAEACLREGFRCVAVERDPDYLPLIQERVRRVALPWRPSRDARVVAAEAGQLGLFDGTAS